MPPASRPESGAGTLVYVGRFDLAEFAVVLEPEEPFESRVARSMPASSRSPDALGGAPPERPITFDWPDAVRVNGGLVGGARLGWPQDAPENKPPAWLVFGAMIRIVAMGEDEPGLRPLSAALDEEGFENFDSDRLVESFARHLMVAIDTWREKGFGEVAKSYLAGLAPESGVRRDLDVNGDLLVRRTVTGGATRSAERWCVRWLNHRGSISRPAARADDANSASDPGWGPA